MKRLGGRLMVQVKMDNPEGKRRARYWAVVSREMTLQFRNIPGCFRSLFEGSP